MGKLTTSYLTAGALVRGQVKKLFLESEKAGCTVEYKEHKGFLETTFTNIRIEGPDRIILVVDRRIKEMIG